MLFICKIEGRPYIKKNTARHYRFGVVYSKQYKAWEKIAIIAINKAKLEYPTTIDYPVTAVFRFSFLNHQAEPDISNICEGIQDTLEKCGVIKNDRLIYKLVATKHFGIPYSTSVELYGR